MKCEICNYEDTKDNEFKSVYIENLNKEIELCKYCRKDLIDALLKEAQNE